MGTRLLLGLLIPASRTGWRFRRDLGSAELGSLHDAAVSQDQITGESNIGMMRMDGGMQRTEWGHMLLRSQDRTGQ
jgi:hypothetical protein